MYTRPTEPCQENTRVGHSLRLAARRDGLLESTVVALHLQEAEEDGGSAATQGPCSQRPGATGWL